MNAYYKQPTLVFGLIIPAVLLMVLLGAGFHFKGKLETEYRVRKSDYAKYQKEQKVREGLEKTIRKQDPMMKSWMELFDTPTASRVNGLLGEVTQQYSGEEFQQTSFRRSNSSGGIGGASAQSSVRLELKFRGTYRGLQNAFLKLETHMPHLQLDSLKMRQESNRNLLNAELTYTAWQKERS